MLYVIHYPEIFKKIALVTHICSNSLLSPSTPNDILLDLFSSLHLNLHKLISSHLNSEVLEQLTNFL